MTMNSRTHRLIAIPRTIRLHAIYDFAARQAKSLKIDQASGLLMVVDPPQAQPLTADRPAPSFPIAPEGI